MRESRDQKEAGLDFDGFGGKGYSRENKYAGNHYSGKTDGDELVNKGRGPTKGNSDTTTHQGRRPPVSNVPERKIKNPDYINGGAQVRSPGGTTEFPKRGREDFNFGRGPTKGNQE